MSDVVLLCGGGASSAAVANALVKRFGNIPILVEGKEERSRFLRRRIRRQGLTTVVGQLAFVGLVVPLLRSRSRRRIEEIAAAGGLDFDRGQLDAADRVTSVNSPEAVKWLEQKQPRVVVINGTRIIGRHVLGATDAVFINTHAGITPDYRGAHGGYWALLNGDKEKCGVTVHVVDAGIDTGGVVGQAMIAPETADNFVTYPILQLAAGLPMLLDAVAAALKGKLETRAHSGDGGLWYHPTAWRYLSAGVRKGVW